MQPKGCIIEACGAGTGVCRRERNKHCLTWHCWIRDKGRRRERKRRKREENEERENEERWLWGRTEKEKWKEDLKWKVTRVNGRKRRTKTKMVLLLWSHGMVRVRLNLAPDILGILDNRAKGGSKELILDSGTLGVYLKSLFWEFILGVYSTSLFWEYSGIVLVDWRLCSEHSPFWRHEGSYLPRNRRDR